MRIMMTKAETHIQSLKSAGKFFMIFATLVSASLLGSVFVCPVRSDGEFPLLREDDLLEYSFLRTYNFVHGEWSGQIQVSGSSMYLVKEISDDSIVLEERVDGDIIWPKGAVMKRIFYLYLNGSVGGVSSGNNFTYRNTLTFQNGTVIDVSGLSKYCEVVFACLHDSVWQDFYLMPLSQFTNTPLFLTQKPVPGQNITVFGSEFETLNETIQISIPAGSREGIIGNATYRSEDVNQFVYGSWDEETGICLRFSMLSCVLGRKISDLLMWELRSTSVFLPSPSYRGSLLMNVSYFVDSSFNVHARAEYTICDIMPRDGLNFLFDGALGPSNFSAYDKTTGSQLKVSQDFMGKYIVPYIEFPTRIDAGTSYSFILENDFERMIVPVGNLYRLYAEHTAYGLPTNYSIRIGLPRNYLSELEEGLLDFHNGTFRNISPDEYYSNGSKIFNFSSILIGEEKTIKITINFWEPTRMAKVQAPVLADPVAIVEIKNEAIVTVENLGDDSDLTIYLIGSSNLLITDENQTIFLESGKSTTITFDLATVSYGENSWIQASVYWNTTELDVSPTTSFNVAENLTLVIEAIGVGVLVAFVTTVVMYLIFGKIIGIEKFISIFASFGLGIAVLHLMLYFSAPRFSEAFYLLIRLVTHFATLATALLFIWKYRITAKANEQKD